MRLRMSLRKKTMLMLLLALLATSGIGMGVGYFFGFGLLHDTVSSDYVKIAQLLGEHVNLKIDDKVEEMNAYFASSRVVGAIAETNAALSGMDEATRDEMYSYIDVKWRTAPGDAPILDEYLERPLSLMLKGIVEEDREVGEILITDRFGGLVAASGRTSDFYQADENWWKKAYDGGKGMVFIQGFVHDESADIMSLSMAVPVRGEAGDVKGVAKIVIDIKEFTVSLERFQMGITGHTTLVDSEGLVIYRKGAITYHADKEPLPGSVFSEDTFEEVFTRENGWATIRLPDSREEVFIAYSFIRNTYIAGSGIELIVMVEARTEEIFFPIKKLVLQMLGVFGLLILVWIPIGLLFGNLFVKPLKKLHSATEHIEKGELDHPIDVRTGDEIEQLADAFGKAVATIRSRERDLKELNDKLEEKVGERTRELRDAQEATIHILEDLEKAKDQLEKRTKRLDRELEKSEKRRRLMGSMLQDNNEIRKKLEGKVRELKETQNMLVQTEKLVSLGRLVSEMAHEVNNPLQVISGRVQLSLMEDIEDEDLRKGLKTIEEQCYRARDIIKRLLEFSRPSKGKTKTEDIRKLLEDTVKLLEHQYSLEGISIAKEYAPQELKVEVDPNQVEEVFFNVIKNAAEAMEGGGNITVSTSEEDGMVRVDLRDTGPGMTKEAMKKIFDPFFTTKEEGTGLGLSVCYGIVKDHGGEMRYESEPGKGTTAIITLPMKEGDEA